MRAAPALALLVLAAAANGALAQTFVTQPQAYLMTTDAADGRALWLQPAGLAQREASVAAMFTAYSGEISQYGITVASGGLGLGWQHDRRPGGDGNVFSAGLGLGGPQLGFGFDKRWYKSGSVSDGSWDVGVRGMLNPLLELSAVWRDIGTPAFTDTFTILPTLVPAAALHLGRVNIMGEWEIVTRGWGTNAYRLGASAQLTPDLMATLRSELTPGFSSRSFAISITWSRAARARVTAFGVGQRSTSGEYGAWIQALRDLNQPVRGRGF